ncbi:MAG: leucyl aminopeptidase [Bacteroidales bacterium]|nr:leucyl aminopeptidase [Bacteroidales bacterium]
MNSYLKPTGYKSVYTLYLLSKQAEILPALFSEDETRFILQEKEKKHDLVHLNRLSSQLFIQFLDTENLNYKTNEKARSEASGVCKKLNSLKANELHIIDLIEEKALTLAYAEGLILNNYQFIKYYKNQEEKKNSLESLFITSPVVSDDEMHELQVVTEAVYRARTWINEPVNYLTAVQLSEEIRELGHQCGFQVEVFDKSRIKALKMGGLLAVNKGSQDPPSFNILEWKPTNAKNEQPLILVGKGVTYDTGGLSLKPTSNSMDYMKSDMSGAAAVAGLISVLAQLKLPVHVIGLIPATDNRPGENAITPGDIIEMHNGLFVEVLNTDAEGRLILGDALSYAQRYQPELVIDLATLTGAASVTVGIYGSIVMGNVGEPIMTELKNAGFETYERLVELPMWDEYGDMIKSDVADIKNSTKRDGGTITAGKFLERFTDYPWVHLDIAPSAFLHSNENYKPQGGVGVGIRLLFEFIKKHYLA